MSLNVKVLNSPAWRDPPPGSELVSPSNSPGKTLRRTARRKSSRSRWMTADGQWERRSTALSKTQPWLTKGGNRPPLLSQEHSTWLPVFTAGSSKCLRTAPSRSPHRVPCYRLDAPTPNGSLSRSFVCLSRAVNQPHLKQVSHQLWMTSPPVRPQLTHYSMVLYLVHVNFFHIRDQMSWWWCPKSVKQAQAAL